MQSSPFSIGPLEQFSEQATPRIHMKPITPNTQLDDHRIDLLASELERSRDFCSNCGLKAILSDDALCADCTYEKKILNYTALTGEPLYVLTENLTAYVVNQITCIPNSRYYKVHVPELSFPIRVTLEDFHLSLHSLITTGISRANDAILRFNTLHKQHFLPQ